MPPLTVLRPALSMNLFGSLKKHISSVCLMSPMKKCLLARTRTLLYKPAEPWARSRQSGAEHWVGVW